MSKFRKIFLKSKLKLCLFYSGGGGKGQALLVFQRWPCVSAKTKCA